MSVLAESLKTWIGKFVDISEGIPSWYTLEKVFSSINPSKMEEMLIKVMDIIREQKKSRGRVEKRVYHMLSGEELPSAKEWKNLKSVGMVTRERTIGNDTTKEIVYYISSCEIDALLFANCVRGHWGIENGLHWSLDVVFREDKLTYRNRIGAQNLVIVRKIVLGTLAKDKQHKCGKPSKRLLAASNPTYRGEVLKYLF